MFFNFFIFLINKYKFNFFLVEFSNESKNLSQTYQYSEFNRNKLKYSHHCTPYFSQKYDSNLFSRQSTSVGQETRKSTGNSQEGGQAAKTSLEPNQSNQSTRNNRKTIKYSQEAIRTSLETRKSTENSQEAIKYSLEPARTILKQINTRIEPIRTNLEPKQPKINSHETIKYRLEPVGSSLEPKLSTRNSLETRQSNRSNLDKNSILALSHQSTPLQFISLVSKSEVSIFSSKKGLFNETKPTVIESGNIKLNFIISSDNKNF